MIERRKEAAKQMRRNALAAFEKAEAVRRVKEERGALSLGDSEATEPLVQSAPEEATVDIPEERLDGGNDGEDLETETETDATLSPPTDSATERPRSSTLEARTSRVLLPSLEQCPQRWLVFAQSATFLSNQWLRSIWRRHRSSGRGVCHRRLGSPSCSGCRVAAALRAVTRRRDRASAETVAVVPGNLCELAARAKRVHISFKALPNRSTRGPSDIY